MQPLEDRGLSAVGTQSSVLMFSVVIINKSLRPNRELQSDCYAIQTALASVQVTVGQHQEETVRKENRNRAERQINGGDPIGLPQNPLSQRQPSLLSAHLGVTQQTLRHVDVITQHLRHHSILLDLVAIQLYQQLIHLYGAELDQQITSDTILTDIKNLVETQFETHQLWQASAKEIWSSLVLRTIQDMQRDLGNNVLESLDWEAFNRILFQYLFHSQAETIDQRIRHLEEFYAQTIATQIVEQLNLSRQPVLALKRLLGLRSEAPQTTAPTRPAPRTQRGPIAEIPSQFPVLVREEVSDRLSFVDQLQADLWQSDASSMVYRRYLAKHNRNHYLEHYIASPGDLEMLIWEAAEQILQKFGINAVKLHCVLAAHAMQQAVPWHSPFTLSARETIAVLGWQDRPDALHQASSLAYALSCLLIKCVCTEGQTLQQSGIHTPVSQLWDVLIAPQGEFDWTTGRIETPEDVQFTVRSGLWIAFFEQSERFRGALHQFGQLAQQLLHHGAYAHDLTLRLVIHLMLDTRIRATHPHPHVYQIKTLLETVCSEAIVQQAQTHTEQGQALFADWNQALMLLAQLGWGGDRQLGATSPTVESGLGFYLSPYPRWLDPEQNIRKPRGWINSWLEQKLVIKPLE